GTLLFLASVAGQIGSQTDPPYSASKAALINFAQCAAKDLAPYGVRVNALCPGMVRTDLNRPVWEGGWRRQAAGGRQGDEEGAGRAGGGCGGAVGRRQRTSPPWPSSSPPRAPRKNVTGQTVNVDGGFVMHW